MDRGKQDTRADVFRNHLQLLLEDSLMASVYFAEGLGLSKILHGIREWDVKIVVIAVCFECALD